MGRRWIVGLLLALAVLFGGATGSRAQEFENSLTFDGIERTYTLTVPASYDEDTPAPLIVVLHPFASSGRAMQTITGFDALAEAHGFLVVYPDAVTFGWDDGRSNIGWPRALDASDDVGYINALIDHLGESYAIDPAQVYLTGIANGGTMAYRLACEMPERFARVAVVGALLWSYQVENCGAEGGAVPMLILVGDQDPAYPFGGRLVELPNRPSPERILGAYETFEFWQTRNGCDAGAVQKPDGQRVHLNAACQDDSSAALYTLGGMAGNWLRSGNYTLNQFGVDLTGIITGYFLDGPDWAALTKASMTERGDVFGGLARSYTLYVPPSYDPAQPTPLVIGLHGRTDTGAGFAYLLDLNPVADEHGFIAVYPDGIAREWNYPRGGQYFQDTEIDDTAFLRALVEDLARDLNIDQQRLYITGFSNGGFMTQRLACEGADQFAAFASVGATLYPEFETLCEDTRPVPVLLMHGTYDASVPWVGSVYDGIEIAFSMPDTALFWAMHNQCEPAKTTYELLPQGGDSPETTVYHYTFVGCDGGSALEYYVIDGGGHNLPGVIGRLSPEIAGATNMDIKAAEVIWAFFEQHTFTAP